MATTKQVKQQIIQLLDTLPAERLEEVVDFVEFLRSKHGLPSPMYVPVALGGLWSGTSADESDLAEIRQDMWGGFGERES